MQNKSTINPLVSIVVVTYNSAKYVLDTLESAKAQTYKNIELIISDDCSTDNTVEICRNWLKNNSNYFVDSKIIDVEENTGIPANCNRGVRKASGEWVKLIAGDDALMVNCVDNNIEFSISEINAGVIFSAEKQYKEILIEKNYTRRIPKQKQSSFFADDVSAQDQYNLLLIDDRIGFTATSFIKKEILIKVGLFNEKYKLIEDYPMWLKLTQADYRLFFMDKETVKHRTHENNVVNTTKTPLIKPAFIRNEQLRRELVYPYLKWNYRFEIKWRYYMSNILLRIFNNNSNPFTRLVSRILIRYLNPFYWVTKL